MIYVKLLIISAVIIFPTAYGFSIVPFPFLLPYAITSISKPKFKDVSCKHILRMSSSTSTQTTTTNPYNAERANEEHLVDEIRLSIANIIEPLVQQRADARKMQDYKLADSLRDEIDNNATKLLPDGYKLVVSDVPYNEGGGSFWSVEFADVEETHDMPGERSNVLSLAHQALGLAIHASTLRGNGMIYCNYETELNKIVESTLIALRDYKSVSHTLQGRKAADTAFWFALAGVTNNELFNRLGYVAADELCRFGKRKSCRAVDIYNIVERLAAAGISDVTGLAVFDAAADALIEKFDPPRTSDFLTNKNCLELHNERSLLFLWRFSTKQRKLKAFQSHAERHWSESSHKKADITEAIIEDRKIDWYEVFIDPSKPLIVDIGCGMGVSLLGLAICNELSPHPGLSDLDFEGCNFLGVDLSQLTTGYAKGIASRWGIQGKVYFCVASAEDIADELQSYPGGLKLAMLQFPTPFRLVHNSDDDFNGNAQLPSNASNGFMVTYALLRSLWKSLISNNGKLLLQSNCEDVAVYMRDEACVNAGFCCLEAPDIVDEQRLSLSTAQIPKRTQTWVKLGGRRACGFGWSKTPMLPSKGATETEIAYRMSSTPIHRCLLEPCKSK